jgi:predicted secreted protein
MSVVLGATGATVSAAEVSAAEVSAAEVVLASSFPEYGVPGDSFADDSSSLVVGAGSLTIGMSSNLNNMTRPANTILYNGQIGTFPKQTTFANTENVADGSIGTASRAEPTNFTDIHVEGDGSAIIGNTNANNILHRATLTSDFDLTGATSTYGTAIANIGTPFGLAGTNVYGAWVNEAGTRFWASTNTQVRMATMETPFDYPNMVDSGNAQTIGAASNNWSICLTPDEKFVLAIDNTTHTLKVWELTTPGSLAAWTLRNTLNLNSLFGYTSPSGVAIDVWRKKIYVGFRTGDIVRQFSWT